ncbi:MAG: hypothetical protein EU552_02700 [Promethearchaeota archaeon]|jgi:hypothetical protein|nr:MAG: hypothetical protein EU552_02700 [Candidatus Lokiarchaeota archaeon]
MDPAENSDIVQPNLFKKYYRPDYSHLFNKIKDIKTPVKNGILMGLLDGNWHSELELIRMAKKKQKYMGAVTLGTMVNSLNHSLKNDYVEKKVMNGKLHYKISDNYVGLTRAAYNKYRFNNE